MAAFHSAGVNRVSVGVQALNDEDLKALGRQHSSEEAIAAFRLAAQIFPRCSFDMIYARPSQTPEQWRAELTRALTEQQGHMSLYQLTIEPGTAYFDLYEKGRLQTPSDDRAADLYVSASRSDGSSISLLEAMASGLPVVATKVGGNSEVVEDGLTGLLVPSADPNALAEAILRLWQSPDEATAMGVAGRQDFNFFRDRYCAMPRAASQGQVV